MSHMPHLRRGRKIRKPWTGGTFLFGAGLLGIFELLSNL